MKILALDTSGTDCAVCIYDAAAGGVLSEVTENIGKGHAERLMALVEHVFSEANLKLSDIDRVAVTIGPGSFTGIRVGVAAARGFAVSLGIDAVGVTTLETVARAYQKQNLGRPVAVAFDAKREEVYLQLFDAQGQPSSAEQLVSITAAQDQLEDFAGDIVGTGIGVLRLQEPLSDKDHFPIAIVAELAAEKHPDIAKPKPLYLRGPDARPQTGFALERQV